MPGVTPHRLSCSRDGPTRGVRPRVVPHVSFRAMFIVTGAHGEATRPRRARRRMHSRFGRPQLSESETTPSGCRGRCRTRARGIPVRACAGADACALRDAVLSAGRRSRGDVSNSIGDARSNALRRGDFSPRRHDIKRRVDHRRRRMLRGRLRQTREILSSNDGCRRFCVPHTSERYTR